MRMVFSQIYASADAQFPFSYHFQVKLTKEMSERVSASPRYIERWGSEYDLIIRVSAKRQTERNEIRGPIVYKKNKDVEYVIFLPYDVIVKEASVVRAVLHWLHQGIYAVLSELDIDAGAVVANEASLTDEICNDPAMLTHKREVVRKPVNPRHGAGGD